MCSLIDYQSLYPMILEQPSLNALGTIVLISHLAFKFRILAIGVRVMHANQKEAKICYNECMRENQP